MTNDIVNNMNQRVCVLYKYEFTLNPFTFKSAKKETIFITLEKHRIVYLKTKKIISYRK